MTDQPTRPDVVARVGDVCSRCITEADPIARAEWADRSTWATSAEVTAGFALATDGLTELFARYDEAKQADIDSGLDDWLFAVTHGIRWDS